MRVFNPNNLPLIDYHDALPLQGELKDLNEANYNKLKNVLNKRGFKVPLFLWQQGDLYYLLDGHQRQRVMVKEDMKPYEVPYLLIDADTEAEAKAQLLEIASQYGRITQEGFDSFIINLPELDIQDINFDALQFVGQELEVEEDEAPEVSSEPAVSKLGEIYKLGQHKLMCGDSIDSSDVYVLIRGDKADMVFTDPPWNVDYGVVDKNNQQGYKPRSIKNDNLGEDFKPWLKAVFSGMTNISKPGCPTYVVMSAQEWGTLMDTMVANDYHWSSTIIWAKDRLVLSRKDYHTQYEPIWYGWKEGSRLAPLDNRKQSDLWEIPRPSSSEEHPTMKPIELCARAISNSSKKDDIVLDLFGGSGSTLIACEQLERICYMMELEPKYCDVIRKRYAKFVSNDEIPENWAELTPTLK